MCNKCERCKTDFVDDIENLHALPIATHHNVCQSCYIDWLNTFTELDLQLDIVDAKCDYVQDNDSGIDTFEALIRERFAVRRKLLKSTYAWIEEGINA